MALRLLRHGPASRADLAETLGLSAPTLTRTTAPLLALGLVSEGQPRVAGAYGRPSVPLIAHADAGVLLGVSITHHDVVMVATDLRATILASRSEPVAETSVTAIAEAIGRLAADLSRELGRDRVLAVGVCLGGNVEGGRRVLHAPFLGWADVALADVLEPLVGLPVLVENDLAALAEAEVWFGVGLTVGRFIVITVGVGTGYALVIDREVITNADSGFGTMTEPLLRNWPDFARSAQMTPAQADQAASRVGKLIGTAAAFAMPDHVVLGGEAAHVLIGREDAIQRGIETVRHRLAGRLPVTVHDPGFGFWARGAAVCALSWVAAPR